jgi:hypothetical protein
LTTAFAFSNGTQNHTWDRDLGGAENSAVGLGECGDFRDKCGNFRSNSRQKPERGLDTGVYGLSDHPAVAAGNR